MSGTGKRSWDEVVDSIRSAASDVRSAAGRAGAAGADEEAAATRLKGDISHLEQSASDLLGNFARTLDQQRSDVTASFDRQRAEASTDQIRTSLEELAALATRLTSDVASAAGSSLKQAEPDLKNAVRALEDGSASAAAWIRTTIDPPREGPTSTSSADRPPRDSL